MAVEIGELRARLTAEAQELKAEIRATKKDFADLGEQGKKTADEIGTLNSALGRVGDSKDQINRLTSTLDNVNAKIEIQRKKLSELKQSYDATFDESKKSKLQEQIVNTEATLIRLTNTSDQTSQKIWALEDSLDQAGAGGQQAATQMNSLDNALKEIGLNADQIKTIKKHLDQADPAKLDRQLDELSTALRKLGVDSKQIEKITKELRQSEQEAQKTKQGINGIATGLASLGAGAATAKLTRIIKSLADESQQLSMSYAGLSQVSKSFNVDSEGAVNLAEKLADRWGLNKSVLADTVKTYTSMNLTLEETEKIITATADAAAYNRQAHLSWDEAIKQVAEGIKSGNSNLTDAAGITTNLSVMQERFAKSIGTTAGKLTEAGKIQAAFNGMLEEGAIFAGNADEAMAGYTGTQATFNNTLQIARQELGESFLPVLQEIMEEIQPLIKGFAEWASENKEVVAGTSAASVAFTAFIAVVGALATAFLILNSAMGGIGVLLTVVGAVAAGVTAYSYAADAASGSVLKLAKSQEELNRKLNESPTTWSVIDVENAKADIEVLNELVEERIKLQEKLNAILSKGEEELSQNVDLLAELNETSDKLRLIDKQLKEMDFDTPEQAAEALKKMNAAVSSATPALLEMERAELAGVAAKVQHIDKVNGLKREYDELNGKEKLSEEQKQQLNTVVRNLVKEYPSLIAQLDEENRWHITNRGSLDDLIEAEQASVSASAQASKDRLTNWKTETEAKLKLAKLQIGALEKVEKFDFSKSKVGQKLPSELAKTIDFVGDMVVRGVRNQVQENANNYQLEINEIDKDLQAITEGAFDKFLNFSGGGDLYSEGTDKKKKEKKKTAAELRKDAYDAAIATVQYQAEMYDWTAEKQIEAYEKIRKKHKQHLKETIDDERQLNLQVKRLQEDSIKSRFDFSGEWIGREERRMEESEKTEIEIAQMKIDVSTPVRNRYDKDSEYYKQADDQLYRARKELVKLQEQAEKDATKAREERIKEYQKQNDDLLKSELKAIDKARKAELDAIDKRKKEYVAAQNEKNAAIDALLKKEEELNADVDFETKLAEKMARRDLLSTAVSPEGRKELADTIAEIERMQLEQSRLLRKRDLEDQKQKLKDEKDENEDAYDEEKRLTEARYDALTEAFKEHQDDIEFIENAIKNFRVGANQDANSQILSDLDIFISEYRNRMAAITALSPSTGGGTQAELDLSEYNANKDAWGAAKARGDKEEMARLTARNDEIRKLYGIEKDTGKLPSFDVGGVVPGPTGAPMQAIIHGGEVIFNPGQFENMFRRLTAPVATPSLSRPSAPVQHIENHFDMSVGTVQIEDQTDAEILYTERERAARRLATTGGGK